MHNYLSLIVLLCYGKLVKGTAYLMYNILCAVSEQNSIMVQAGWIFVWQGSNSRVYIASEERNCKEIKRIWKTKD